MKKSMKIQGLDCANCAAKIEAGIAKLEGVESVSVNFLSQKLVLCAQEKDMDEIIEKVKKIVRKVEPDAQIVS